MQTIQLADGRGAFLVTGSVCIIDKPVIPPSSYRHTYTAIVGNQEMTWEAHDQWPEVPAGVWAYRVVQVDGRYVTRPWNPVAGGHGRTVQDVLNELALARG